MADPNVEAPQTVAAGSMPKGVLAGLCGSLLSVPLLAVSFIVAWFFERTLLSKVLGYKVSHDSMRFGSEGRMGPAVVAGATGLIGGCIAAAIVLKLMPNAARRPFFAFMGFGLTAVMAVAWLWLKTRLSLGPGELAFYVVLAWLGALLGMFAATLTDEDQDSGGEALPAEPVV